MTDEIRNDNFTNETECETRADNAQNEVVIEIRHLGKSFGDHEVLKDIDFTVRRGDVTCIIGASGSGKSTLLRCINLFETPSSGEILLNGENVVNTKNPAEFRKKVGMVFQSFNLFKNMNVLKNCTVGPRKVLKLSKEDIQQKRSKDPLLDSLINKYSQADAEVVKAETAKSDAPSDDALKKLKETRVQVKQKIVDRLQSPS